MSIRDQFNNAAKGLAAGALVASSMLAASTLAPITAPPLQQTSVTKALEPVKPSTIDITRDLINFPESNLSSSLSLRERLAEDIKRRVDGIRKETVDPETGKQLLSLENDHKRRKEFPAEEKFVSSDEMMAAVRSMSRQNDFE